MRRKSIDTIWHYKNQIDNVIRKKNIAKEDAP